MTREEAIKVLLDEWKCIDRNDGINCDRKCESCDLVMDSFVLKDAYNMAIKALEQEPCEDAVSRGVFEQVMWERDIAIEQLHELGYELGQKIEPCEDAISRQAAIEAFKPRGIAEDVWQECNEYRVLSSLPSVKPQYTDDEIQKIQDLEQAEIQKAYELGQEDKPTGHWFVDERPESDREIICSNCEQPIFKYHKMDFDYRPKYCPNCGARMVEPQESDHTCHTCKHYTSGERDGSCGSYICKGYSNWESEDKE